MIFDLNTNPTEIDHNNVVIKSNGDGYKGTKLDLVTEFGLYHDGNEIFRRVFDGSSSSIVDTSSKAVAIPNHFFVTGEEVRYSYPGAREQHKLSKSHQPMFLVLVLQTNYQPICLL